MINDLIKKVAGYSKTERIQRLIELSVKAEENPFVYIEIEMIQAIREANGELDEVRKQREIEERDESIS